MQGFELAAISVPPSDFHNFFEVATGHRRNAGNRAGGHFLSSLFSLLSFLCSVIAPFLCARLAEQDPCIFARDYEASRPPTLQKCSDSRRPRGQQTLLSINLGISGGFFCDLSSLFTRCWSVHRSHFAFLFRALVCFEKVSMTSWVLYSGTFATHLWHLVCSTVGPLSLACGISCALLHIFLYSSSRLLCYFARCSFCFPLCCRRHDS